MLDEPLESGSSGPVESIVNERGEVGAPSSEPVFENLDLSTPKLSRSDYFFGTTKVCLIGDPKSGKTSILNRIISEKKCDVSTDDPDSYSDVYRLTFHTSNGDCDLEVWDSPNEHSWVGANVFIVVFDLTSIESTHNAHNWVRKVRKFSEDAKIIVAGNKFDTWKRIDHRVNSISNVRGLTYYDVSAKSGLNVSVMFSSIVRSVVSVISGRVTQFCE